MHARGRIAEGAGEIPLRTPGEIDLDRNVFRPGVNGSFPVAGRIDGRLRGNSDAYEEQKQRNEHDSVRDDHDDLLSQKSRRAKFAAAA